MSWIWTLTSKITQVCWDICDIKLRQLLITRSEEEPDSITNHILTNQNDHKDTLGSNKNKPGTLDVHEGHAEDENDYAYKTPSHHEHNNWDNLQRHDTYPLQWPEEPSETPPKPPPCLDPSEASKRSSLPPASLWSPPKKDNIEPNRLLMYTERPALSWNLCLAPTKKYGRAEPEEESEMKAWSFQISPTLILTNSISGVEPTSRVGWGRFSLA